ncbi:MAG: hypothetical protein AB2A00_30535 [Myxococcota bacterium]
MVVVVERNSPLPTAEARAELMEGRRLYADRLAAVAVVYEGNGFRAATVRSIATTLNALTKRLLPEEVFDRVDHAADWVCAQLRATENVNLASVEVQAAVNHARGLRRRQGTAA